MELNGDKYDGEFEDNEYHGQGTRVWKNGSQYSGQWKKGDRTGRGTETLPNGQVHRFPPLALLVLKVGESDSLQIFLRRRLRFTACKLTISDFPT